MTIIVIYILILLFFLHLFYQILEELSNSPEEIIHDPVREMVDIFTGKVCIHPDIKSFRTLMFDLIQPILDNMPNIDHDEIRCSIMRTNVVQIGQPDHFDFSFLKYPQMTKKKSWLIHDSMVFIIQLRGMSQIFVNKSAQEYFIENVDGDTINHFKHIEKHTKILSQGFKSIDDVMFNYKPPKNEVREAITIYPGQMLSFLSSFSHGGMGCLNVDNDRAHITVPTKNVENMEDVIIIRSNTRIQSSFFRTGLTSKKN